LKDHAVAVSHLDATLLSRRIEHDVRGRNWQIESMREGLHWSGVMVDVKAQLEQELSELPLPPAPDCLDWCTAHDHVHGWEDGDDADYGWKACIVDVYRANPGPGIAVDVERSASSTRGDLDAKVGVPMVVLNGEFYAPSQARKIARSQDRKIAKALRDAADIAGGKPIPADIRPRFGPRAASRACRAHKESPDLPTARSRRSASLG
jgi:hypothetical protein